MQFNPLEKLIINKIIDEYVLKLNNRLKKHHININISDAVRKYLIKNGFSRKMGARPLERAVEEHISKPVAEYIISGCGNWSNLHFDVDNDTICLARVTKDKAHSKKIANVKSMSKEVI